MSGVSSANYDDGNCPCNDRPGGTQNVQSFIGNDYFCESGPVHLSSLLMILYGMVIGVARKNFNAVQLILTSHGSTKHSTHHQLIT